MSRAQLRKKTSGRIRMIWSTAGSKSQLSFPGKNRAWNTTKARSKSREASRPTTAKTMPSPAGQPRSRGPGPEGAGHQAHPPAQQEPEEQEGGRQGQHGQIQQEEDPHIGKMVPAGL